MPTVTTQTDGKFSFDLEPGIYRIIADVNGYVPAELGQRGTLGMGTPVYVEAGQTLNALTIRMTRTGVVTGRIVDMAGVPAEQVPVEVFRVSYNRLGQRLMDVGAIAVTDDRGTYRLHGVTPGRYYVNAGSMAISDAAVLAVGRAVLEGVEPGMIRDARSLTQIYRMTYYPGVSELDRAATIEVKAGEESRADMTVTRDTRHRVSGRVVDAQTGRPPTGVSVSLVYETKTGGTSGTTGGRFNTETGAFSFQDVLPASYTVRAEGRAAQPTGARGADSLAAQMAAAATAQAAAPAVIVPVNVLQDIDNLVLTISPSAPLDGRLTVNGETPSTLPLDRLRAGLRPFKDGGVSPAGPAVQVSPDGAFHFDGIREGDYKFAITGMPPGFYVEKAEIKGVDLLGDVMHYSPTLGGSLEVVLQRGTGAITGTVIDAQSKTAAGVEVVLVPDQRRRLDLYSTAIADRNGRFTLTEIPPGNYRLFSWEAIEPYSYFDPEVLSRYEMRGTPARVAASSNNAVTLTIIAAEP
jgi:5-hydroxyisourate hydrolase-like protein (transthyretin family)